MANCLVTKLKASVDDDSLYKLGETRFEFLHEGDGFMISKGGGYLKVLQGELYYKNISTILTKDSEPQVISTWTPLKAKTDNTIISISYKYSIERIQKTEDSFPSTFRFKVLDSSFYNYYTSVDSLSYAATIYLDNKPFGYAPNVTTLGIASAPLMLYGLSFENFDIKHLPKLANLSIGYSEAMRIENFASHIGLTYMSYRTNTLMQGDLMDFMNKWKSLGVRNKEIHFETSTSTTANGVNTKYKEQWYGTIDSEGNITLEKR